MLFKVVPTGVGVNRVVKLPQVTEKSRPHGRGGEPYMTPELSSTAAVVPTGVGVNRPDPREAGARSRRPHGRGGEPI